jgi:hypothetical protein
MYKLTPSNTIIRTTDHAHIPMNEKNADYRAYLRWVAAGGVPDPADVLVITPTLTISRRQFFQQAAIAGFITNADALAAMSGTIPSTLLTVVNALPTDADKFNAKMILTGATTFERNHPLVESVRVAMNLTTKNIDDFFIAAYLL